MGKIYKFLSAGLVAVICFGCGHQISKEERQLREAATKYRDAYVDGFSTFGSKDITTNLARGTIQSVETWSNGWDVFFATKTGGKQEHTLHVYIGSSGKLSRIVRGSDK